MMDIISLANRINMSPSDVTLDDLHEKFVVNEGVSEHDFFLACKAAEFLSPDTEPG